MLFYLISHFYLISQVDFSPLNTKIFLVEISFNRFQNVYLFKTFRGLEIRSGYLLYVIFWRNEHCQWKFFFYSGDY